MHDGPLAILLCKGWIGRCSFRGALRAKFGLLGGGWVRELHASICILAFCFTHLASHKARVQKEARMSCLLAQSGGAGG